MIVVSAKTQFFSNPWVAFVYYLFFVIAPVFLYIIFAERQRPFKALRMTHQPLRSSAIGILIGGVIWVVFFLLNRFGPEQTTINTGVSFLLIVGTVFAGFAEEILFRGFILPRLMTQMTFVKANIFSAILFAALHTAALLQAGALLIPKIILLFIISLWLGYLFKKTRSLWTTIWVHVLYNLAVLFF